MMFQKGLYCNLSINDKMPAWMLLIKRYFIEKGHILFYYCNFPLKLSMSWTVYSWSRELGSHSVSDVKIT